MSTEEKYALETKSNTGCDDLSADQVPRSYLVTAASKNIPPSVYSIQETCTLSLEYQSNVNSCQHLEIVKHCKTRAFPL
jgi:hypothetical protein